MKVFIGYDSGQPEAYHVAAYSIRQRSSKPVCIYPVEINHCRLMGFNREHDPLASTEFTYTRFLVPYLCGYEGVALFMDCDILCQGDICELFSPKYSMGGHSIRCVQHDYTPTSDVKMGGKPQMPYPRKNWSSVMLMNCSRLTLWKPSTVSMMTGAQLHRFIGIRGIGELHPEWNVLDDGPPRYTAEDAKLYHYTTGGPWLAGCENHKEAARWLQERERLCHSQSCPFVTETSIGLTPTTK